MNTDDENDVQPTETNQHIDEVATPVTNPPRQFRGKKRKHFLKDSRERNRTNARMQRRLDKMLQEWMTKTHTPVVALSLHMDKDGLIHTRWTGHPEFETFAMNQVVGDEFKKAGMKIMAFSLDACAKKPTNNGMNKFIKDVLLQGNVIRESSVDRKRTLICQAVLGNDMLQKITWSSSDQPSWWPESLEFKSPNKRPRFSVEELDKILDSCIKFLELEQQESIDESEVGAEEIQRELNKGSKDNEGDTGNTNEVFKEVQIKNRTGSNVSAHMRKIKDDFQNIAWDLATAESFLKAVSHLRSFKEMEDAFNICPDTILEIQENSVRSCNIEEWYRHLIPLEVATTGVEPIRVAGDGNCLYRSVSCSLYGTEDNWSWIKILALKYGVRNIDNVLEELDEINENRANLAYMITTDDVARMCENIHDDRERLCVTIKHELVKTLGFHRYSTILHVFLIAGAHGINLNSYAEREELCFQIKRNGADRTVSILWCPSLPEERINHIVPLIKPSESNFEDMCCCNLGDQCCEKFGISLQQPELCCRYCLRSYHHSCCLQAFNVDATGWQCFCYLKTETLSSLSTLRSKRELKMFLQRNQKGITKYLADITKGRIFCPRIYLFNNKRFSKLRDFGNSLWLLADETEDVLGDYAVRESCKLSKYANLSVSDRTTLNTNVLIPELIAYCIHKEENVPLFRSRLMTGKPERF